MKIGLIVAMQSEFDLIVKIMEQPKVENIGKLTFSSGIIGDKQIVLMKSGIGKVNAAIACVEMIKNFGPNCIINTGLAGGIDRNLSVMDVVLGQDVVYHDVWCGDGNDYGQVQGLPHFYKADDELLKKAQKISSDVKILSGLITTGDKFIDDSKYLNDIKEKFPQGIAADMESAAIAQTCYLYDIPFLAIRIISDTPGIENHYQQYLDFWNKAPEKSLEIIKQLIA
ncbi:MAG: 5'-methylthioadenosine/adenosylhomocysteine nucleosidase [Alphaproteobacteria bacterium]|nr:5'-methylthioadenosine/adenosylhomocysteine nucleosidase [Alphaproteobacteria bacterium]